MSLVSKKQLIKQQTVYDGEEKTKSKMSLTTKRVSFDSTTISLQSDSDDENSLGRSNRKAVKKPNRDDDDLLNMFKSELSDSEDDILQTRREVESKGVDKPNPVPRHFKSRSSTRENKTSAARSVDQLTDETIHPKFKAKPRPPPRKISGDIQSEEGSPRSSKPEVTLTRKWQSDNTTDHEQHIYGIRRKTKPVDDLQGDSDEDIVVVDSRKENHKLSRVGMRKSSVKKTSDRQLKKENSEEDEYIDQDIVHSTSKTRNESSYSQKELDKEQDERIRVKSFQQGESVNKENIDIEKKYRGMVPAPKPRKHIQDGIHDYMSHNDKDNGHNIEDVRKKGENVPLPKARKEHLELQENEIVSNTILSKSRLHPLDVDDNDESGDETHKNMVSEGVRLPIGSKNGLPKDKLDGKSKKEKTLDWSSLDESDDDDDDDDDDEAVGKKVNLFTKQRQSSAKRIDDNNKKEKGKVPKPSPRPKPRKELANLQKAQQQWQNGTLKNNMNQKDLNSTDFDSYQRVLREQGERDRPWSNTHSRRIGTPQRPVSNKLQSNTGWGRNREKVDITDMFEEHHPDADDLIGGHHSQFHNRKDQLRPRSSVTTNKGPMKADQGIEAMIRSPNLGQSLNYTDIQDWGYISQPSLGKQKSSSLMNLQRIGESDYSNHDEDDGPRRNSLDTETIRQTVYDNWLSRKNVTIKKELSKKALEKQKEQEKRKQEEERKKNAQLAFQSWNKCKTETLKERHSKIKEKQKEEQEKMEIERKMKEKDSKKYFESWKSKKDVLIKETHKEKKKENKMKKKKEEEEQIEKTISSKKSFENWKSKKDTILKQELREKKKKEKGEESKEEEKKYEKTIKNADEFQKWVENKGKPRKGLTSPALTQRAWVPCSQNMSGTCIPATVQPVVLPASTNRARTMSGTYRGKTKYYDF